MSFSLLDIQEDVDTFIRDVVFSGQPVHEQAVEDLTILERMPNGKVRPYVAYLTGDIQPWGSRSFCGPRGDDYVLPVYFKIVVAGDNTPTGIPLGKQLAARCIDRFLGANFDWAGQVRKRAGGSMFPIKKSDGSTEAIVFPVSFGLTVQLNGFWEPPDPENP